MIHGAGAGSRLRHGRRTEVCGSFEQRVCRPVRDGIFRESAAASGSFVLEMLGYGLVRNSGGNIRRAMKIQIPEKVNYVLRTLREHGHEAFVVGGCVRDSLLNKTPADWDITTSAYPEEVKACFPHTADTGIQHGTVSVIVEHEPVEVTTYRVDGTYSDGRHPDTVRFTRSLEEDLARRDFTINAMAYNDESGLQDPCGGRTDLRNGRIRCVGAPEQRFSEDALRILRALRFASVLGFSIEQNTESAIYDLADRVRLVAVERINAEFSKLILGQRADLILTRYRGVLSRATGLRIPAVNDLDRLPFSIPVRLASIADADPKLLKYDNRTVRLVRDIRGALLALGDFSGGYKENSIDGAGGDKENSIDGAGGAGRAVPLYKKENRSGEGTEPARVQLRRLLRMFGEDAVRGALEIRGDDTALLERILTDGDCFSLRQLAVTGRDLGLPPGPKVGKRLNRLLDAVIEEELPNERELLLRRNAAWTNEG